MSYILSLEDDSHIQHFLSVNLSVRGFAIKTASAVQEALTIALSDAPQLVILDMKVSGESGLEFLKACQVNPLLQAVPIIVFTGSSTEQSRQDVVDFPNIVKYLVKPVSLDELLDSVHQAMNASTN